MDVVEKNVSVKRPILSFSSLWKAASVLRNRLGVVAGPSEKEYRVGFLDPKAKNNEVMIRVEEELKSGGWVGKALKTGFKK